MQFRLDIQRARSMWRGDWCGEVDFALTTSLYAMALTIEELAHYRFTSMSDMWTTGQRWQVEA